jgi:hypothetical protein
MEEGNMVSWEEAEDWGKCIHGHWDRPWMSAGQGKTLLL